MTAQARALIPTLIVPDEQTWTLAGSDPAAIGAEPSFEAAATAAVLVPATLPESLRGPLLALLGTLPGGEPVRSRELSLPGGSGAAGGWLVRDPGSADRARSDQDEEAGEGARHGGHGGHGGDNEGDEGEEDGGHDMMEIVGEPSADGLVMERIELSYGPLAVPFPGGLGVEATLDGEVVAEVGLSGISSPAGPSATPPASPDPLAPASWAVAIERAGANGAGGSAGGTTGTGAPSSAASRAIAAIELERAISHLAWLRSLARLLGWNRLVELASAALAPLGGVDLTAAGSADPPGDRDGRVLGRLDRSAGSVARLLELLRTSRTLAWRLTGRGAVGSARAEQLGLDGPAARACGLDRDCRNGDPLYGALGFEPLLGRNGDAATRTLLRAREVAQSLELVRAALALEHGDRQAPSARGAPGDNLEAARGEVEGPRGELRVERSAAGWELSVPGAVAARTLAAEAMVGESWENALVVLASFDLSPWGV